MYVPHLSTGAFHATRIHLCIYCASYDRPPKIQVRRDISDANRFDYDAGDRRFSPPEIVYRPDWDDLTTDEKILAVLEAHADQAHPVQRRLGLEQRNIIFYTGLKRTTVIMALKRLIDKGHIVANDNTPGYLKPKRNRSISYALARYVDND